MDATADNHLSAINFKLAQLQELSHALKAEAESTSSAPDPRLLAKAAAKANALSESLEHHLTKKAEADMQQLQEMERDADAFAKVGDSNAARRSLVGPEMIH